MTHRPLAFYLNPRGPQRREIMRALADAGIRLIGMDGCGWDAEKDRQEIDYFLADLATFGLAVQSMHGIPPLLARADADTPPDLLHALLQDIRRLALFKGKTAVYHACWMRDVPPERFDQAIDAAGWDAFVGRNARTLKLMAREAARHGITVALENIWHSRRAQSVAGFAEILRAAGEPNVAICLDSGHAHLAGAAVGEQIRAAGKLLRDTHFHDNAGPVGGRLFDQHIPPGLGTIDWQDACRALDEIAFPGPVVFEGVLGPGDSIEGGRFGGRLSHKQLIDLSIANWRAFEALAMTRPPA